MFSVISINNIFIKITIISLGILISLITIYKNVNNITNLSKENVKIKVLKKVIISILIFFILFALIISLKNLLSQNEINNLLLILFTLYFIYLGNLSPAIPFNRYVGLRLPWTVADEITWRYAHNILGYISFPIAILMFLIGFFYDFKIAVLSSVLIMAFIPSILSFIYYKKSHQI